MWTRAYDTREGGLSLALRGGIVGPYALVHIYTWLNTFIAELQKINCKKDYKYATCRSTWILIQYTLFGFRRLRHRKQLIAFLGGGGVHIYGFYRIM